MSVQPVEDVRSHDFTRVLLGAQCQLPTGSAGN
jgi:hypothetical protein